MLTSLKEKQRKNKTTTKTRCVTNPLMAWHVPWDLTHQSPHLLKIQHLPIVSRWGSNLQHADLGGYLATPIRPISTVTSFGTSFFLSSTRKTETERNCQSLLSRMVPRMALQAALTSHPVCSHVYLNGGRAISTNPALVSQLTPVDGNDTAFLQS